MTKKFVPVPGESFGRLLRRRRLELSLTARYLGSSITVNPSAIYQYERATILPKESRMLSFAEALGIPSQYASQLWMLAGQKKRSVGRKTLKVFSSDTICQCGSLVYCKEMCQACYSKSRKAKMLTLCETEDCYSTTIQIGLCGRCYSRTRHRFPARSSLYGAGVSKMDGCDRYYVRLLSVRLGNFKTLKEAQAAYDTACWDKYHDLLRLNFPEDYRELAYEYYNVPKGHPKRKK